MRVWIDDLRPAPEGYVWCKSVNEAKDTILMLELYATVDECYKVELIDLDHDAGDYAGEGETTLDFLTGLKRRSAIILFVSTL